MVPNSARRRLAPALLVVCLLTAGCLPQANDDEATEAPNAAAFVPVNGTVTLNGRPLAQAVVTFLPPHWGPGLGETAEDGTFTLSNSGRRGTMIGHYKVAVSLLISADGEPQGLEPRSALVQPKSMLKAKEALPPEIADLGRTTLSAEVKPGGGSFRFDLKADVDLPTPKSAPPAPTP